MVLGAFVVFLAVSGVLFYGSLGDTEVSREDPRRGEYERKDNEQSLKLTEDVWLGSLDNDLGGRYRSAGAEFLHDFTGDGSAELISFRDILKEAFWHETEMAYRGTSFVTDGSLMGVDARDVTGDGIQELIVDTTVGANGIITTVYDVGETAPGLIPVLPKTTGAGFFSGASFVDYDNDGALEARVRERVYPPDPCEETHAYYEYTGEAFVFAERASIVSEEDKEACYEWMRNPYGG